MKEQRSQDLSKREIYIRRGFFRTTFICVTYRCDKIRDWRVTEVISRE
jgi:hypothetical protein